MKDFILGDCMAGMRELPDHYFDLAIVDPPYGINMGNLNRVNKHSDGTRYYANKYKRGDWDKQIPDVAYFDELRRVSKNQIIWGGNYYFDILGNCKGLICWYKHQPVQTFSDCEFAWTSFNKVARVFDYPYYGNVEGKTSASKKIHSTQKPIQLYKWILKNYATPGMKILDTHVGSASSLVAFEDFDCEYMGFEIDPDYYKDAMIRLENRRNSPTIFDK